MSAAASASRSRCITAGEAALAQFRNGRRGEAVATAKAALAVLPPGRFPELEAALATYGAADAK
ncbi:MAG: hypothetical protein LW698_09615 [Planctomycetaceae bacterium]|jgi:hypothetical protein|nr:hypothetical protein [Planctomycetaceae bacterium]